MAFLEEHNLLDDNQHGFRTGRSTISAAVEYLESIIDSVDKGEHVLGKHVVSNEPTKDAQSGLHAVLSKDCIFLTQIYKFCRKCSWTVSFQILIGFVPSNARHYES
ncbi:hypothetical protein J6590_001317 [Homalodisca vitripennis]|nr:hypothetical protein J6590_001317 [Homalodisca vitripennis]